MRYLDDIAELAKAGAKKAVQPKNEPPIETITRVPGGGQTKSLDGLPPEEFAKATGAGRGNRWDW
jgi:hypothetical protein